MSILDEIRAVSPDASSVADIKPSRYFRDDLISAKQKVNDKLTSSKAFAINGFKTDDGNNLDTCFYDVPQRNGYYVGVKYGNRWVKNVFGENQNRYGPLSKEHLITMLDILKKGVENGDFDEQIKATMM